MKYEVLLRSRALRDESIPAKHERLLAGLRQIAPPWGLGDAAGPPAPDPGSELIAQVKLTPFLGKGIRGEVVYQFRRDFRDEGSADDFLSLTFNPEKVDYAAFVDGAFPKYLSALDAYRGELGDAEFTHLDFDAARKVDFRRGVFRIHPVSYYDKQLCLRAFELEPDEIVARLVDRCERVTRHGDGVLVVLSTKPLSLADADQETRAMRQLLRPV